MNKNSERAQRAAEHVKDIADHAAKDLPVPDWVDLGMLHKCETEGHSPFEACALLLRRELDEEQRRSEVLRQSMEDLCSEMENLKKMDSERVFIMGPTREDRDGEADRADTPRSQESRG